jgi:hypothetical protein
MNLARNRGWCFSFGIIDLRRAFLAWNSRPLAAVKEMPIASVVARKTGDSFEEARHDWKHQQTVSSRVNGDEYTTTERRN